MENNPKSQVVERLREAQNVLVTVSANPSVDQLAAAIGFTLMMNKLGKHATAVFSGSVPSTLEFLKPESTLEKNTDSLRDFIIALDKAKADKLRYKVEDDFVKIFITPYRTSLTDADLNFSQGDFNVDVVMALGVDQRDHLDQAILAHGRILHDATVVGVMAGDGQVDLGSINWQDPSASSLCEMLVSISESFQSGLLDEQMATAYLTGIVAETERFSNQKTSPKVMTMSAQLMAAGANQQLIATQISAEEPAFSADLPAPVDNPDEAVLELNHDEDEIEINDQGELNQTDQLAQMVNEVQEGPKGDENEEPVTNNADDEHHSKFMTEPPVGGGTLTANTVPEGDDPSTDPLATTNIDGDKTPSGGTHGRNIRPLGEEPQTSTQSPLISVTDDAESVAATEMPTTPSSFLGSDGTTPPDVNQEIPEAPEEPESETSLPIIDKLGPEVNPSDTLSDIETAVENFSGEAPHVDAAPAAASADAARQAVMDAMASAGGFDPNRPEPIQSLNAQEVQLEQSAELPPLTPQVSPNVVPVDAPPSVPPPMMPPQFPIPGAEVYEPDQDNQNPPAAT